MSANALIREFAVEDTAACMRVFESVSNRYFSTGDEAEFAAFLQSPPGVYYVLVDWNAVVGCGGVSVRGTQALLTWGMVHADRHGQGLGRVLAEFRIRQAKLLPGIASIRLNTSSETVGFYERLGFEVVSYTANGYREGLDRYDLELRV